MSLIFVDGNIAAGKSTLQRKLEPYVHCLDMDNLTKKIYDNINEYPEIREELIFQFGLDSVAGGRVNRAIIMEQVRMHGLGLLEDVEHWINQELYILLENRFFEDCNTKPLVIFHPLIQTVDFDVLNDIYPEFIKFHVVSMRWLLTEKRNQIARVQARDGTDMSYILEVIERQEKDYNPKALVESNYFTNIQFDITADNQGQQINDAYWYIRGLINA